VLPVRRATCRTVRQMAGSRSEEMNLQRLLSASEGAPPVEAITVVAEEIRRAAGGRHVSLLITNLSGTALVRMSHVTDGGKLLDGHNERTEPVLLPGSIYEAAMIRQSTEVVRDEDRWTVLAPVTERGDAIGLLEVCVEDEPDPDVIEMIAGAAHAFAYLLVASRRHTDLYESAQRDVAFSLAAEIQRRLLPPAYTLEAGRFTLAGWLEPASEVGGDTFDYSLDREYLYASITDAMGHGVEAALLATLVVGSLRNSRRAGATPAQQADAANAALLSHARADQFVTGQILRLRLSDGTVEFVNAGHPTPYLVRGNVAREAIVSDPQPAFGITTAAYRPETAKLEPGDRILSVTDGFLERNVARLDLSEILGASNKRHPRQLVRELASHVVAATGGQLRDDATVLCIDWYGPGERSSAARGADAERAPEIA
jgi:serine phosphatase RsbU (regulator of sigma subunit)